jgi:hypothetical protein
LAAGHARGVETGDVHAEGAILAIVLARADDIAVVVDPIGIREIPALCRIRDCIEIDVP